MALDFDLVHARGVIRENAFHTFAIADAADAERLVQARAAFADDDAGENLDAFLSPSTTLVWTLTESPTLNFALSLRNCADSILSCNAWFITFL